MTADGGEGEALTYARLVEKRIRSVVGIGDRIGLTESRDRSVHCPDPHGVTLGEGSLRVRSV